jgi:hypothetical protein
MPTTSRPMVRIHDLSTNEIIDREMNDEEFAHYEAGKSAQAAAAEAKAAAEADKTALLARLGITADEAKLLFS